MTQVNRKQYQLAVWQHSRKGKITHLDHDLPGNNTEHVVADEAGVIVAKNINNREYFVR